MMKGKVIRRCEEVDEAMLLSELARLITLMDERVFIARSV